MFVSNSDSTKAGSRSGSTRLSIVNQNTRPAQNTEHREKPDQSLGGS